MNTDDRGQKTVDRGQLTIDGRRWTEDEICENCEHSVPAAGSSGLTLICNHKAGSEVPWQLVGPDDSCANFEPARDIVPPDIAAALADGARLLPLSQNKFAIVDADDYHRLSKYKWCLSRTPRNNYAMRRTRGKRIKGRPIGRKVIMMHRFIMKAPTHLIVDHTNHNGLDNRKENLRLCTRTQNNRNRRPFCLNGSKYKGVSWEKYRKRFVAAIRCNGKYYNLGRFKSETAAAKAYDKKAKELFGEYACLNFP
ncbi:MAG TPA: hypothetical protein HPP87_11915 [Planctomycetes bacterium]|nr:hypothetical protein [Planctomycetota bacterium]